MACAQNHTVPLQVRVHVPRQCLDTLGTNLCTVSLNTIGVFVELRIEGLQLEYCVGVLLLEVRLQVDALRVLQTDNTRVTKHALLLGEAVCTS